ncbi:MAG: hypothetical protein H0V82_11795 [Candidatus Protochlamydia sp.]|nr:hypothetical protein [Candidatus Protochlamydia sp.]
MISSIPSHPVQVSGFFQEAIVKRFELILANQSFFNNTSFTLQKVIYTVAKLAAFSLILLAATLIGNRLYRFCQTPRIILDQIPPQEIRQIPHLQTDQERLEATSYLENIWSNYNPNTRTSNEFEFSSWQLLFNIILVKEYSNSPICNIAHYDHYLSNILMEFKNDPTIFVLPGEGLNLATDMDSIRLKKILASAFGLGKQMVLVPLVNSVHCITAGFCSDGTVKLIDSMNSSILDVDDLINQLNSEKIKNVDGHSILFHGEYVNTNIQKGGNQCIRFSTLYCYNMAKKRDLNAYEEVNGAFASGNLKIFDDYKQMDGGSRIADMKPFSIDIYLEFMRSWAYRTQGILVDSWQQLTLNEIMKNNTNNSIFFSCQNDSKAFPFLCSKPPIYKLNFIDENGSHLVDTLEDLPLTNIVLPNNFENTCLKEIILTDKACKQIFVINGNNIQTKLYTLLPNQNLYLYNPQNNKKRSFFDLEGWS